MLPDRDFLQTIPHPGAANCHTFGTLDDLIAELSPHVPDVCGRSKCFGEGFHAVR